jgi:uncharacterized protein YecE (DUF72 family)
VFYRKGIPARKWFEYYCWHFDTVELNGTFYRTPKIAQLKAWHDRSPDEFRFSVKAPRLITHYKKFVNANSDVASFYELITDGLGEKLGCVLFQLPPSFAFSDERLENIVRAVNPAYRNVFEFRHASWWQQVVYDAFRQHHITFCSISHPALPGEVVRTSDLLYYRFHGVPELYKSSYSEGELEKILQDILSTRADENYIYFNNTMNGTAIGNIAILKSQLNDISALSTFDQTSQCK